MWSRFLRALAWSMALSTVGHLSTVPAFAGTVQVTESVSGASGNWTLDFSIVNHLTPGFDVYYFGLKVDSNGQTATPLGWGILPPGTLVSGAYGGSYTGPTITFNDQWCVLPHQCYDNLTNSGTTITGFQVHSAAAIAPTALPFLVFAINLTNGNPSDAGCFNCGFNPGFVGTTEVPTPASWTLFGSGLLGLLVARRVNGAGRRHHPRLRERSFLTAGNGSQYRLSVRR